MGITFRSGDYIRFVNFGGRTIKDGEAAAVWNRNGEHTQIVGPKRIILWSSTIRFLTRFKAESNQYLKVDHRNGTVEHVRGPVHMYLNPSYHDNISVKDGYCLKENEVIQVRHMPQLRNDSEGDNNVSYKHDGNAVEQPLLAKESKRLVHGPTLFFPAEDEIVEEFEWSNLPRELGLSKTLTKLSVEKFSVVKLHTNNIWNVIVPVGNDSGRVYASLAITYKIDSFEKVSVYCDPYNPLCAALVADVQELFQEKNAAYATSTFQAVQQDVAETLSNYKVFHQLLDYGEACGFTIHSVKLLEVSPGEKIKTQLNQEHDHAMQIKAQIAKKESAIRFQELELEERQKKMENNIALARNEAKMKADLQIQKMKALNQENELAKIRQERQLEAWRASDETVLDFLKNLKELGVDMSTFMCTAGGKKTTSDILKRAPSLAPSASAPKQKKTGDENDE